MRGAWRVVRVHLSWLLLGALVGACGFVHEDEAGDRAAAGKLIETSPTSPPLLACIQIRLSGHNLFLLEDYSQGHDVQGKVAAGGNITLTDFAVGAGVPDSNTAQVLVAGGHLTLSRGGVWGDAWYGGDYTTDPSVVFPRGTAAHGTPIDFAARFAELRGLSSRLAGLAVNGMTTVEPWGGVMLRGTAPDVNVFQVNANSFTGAKLLSIDAPAGSLAVVNISGSTATFTGFGHSFSGGIDQHGVLYNFPEATSINADGFGFWGTLLAPQAHIHFSNGSWDGGIYARSLTGNAEGHINALSDRDIGGSCGGHDNDCDGPSGEGGPLNTYYRDADGDGYGNAAVSTQACSAPAGYVSNSSDCNDSNASVKPGAAEACNGVDDNCNGSIDEGVGGDTTYYRDADGDGRGNAAESIQACSAPAGYVSDSSDCNDADATLPRAFSQDFDGDGYGDIWAISPAPWGCTPPPGYGATSNDCDDTDPSVHPGAAEVCDGKDNNCNSIVDEGTSCAQETFPTPQLYTPLEVQQ